MTSLTRFTVILTIRVWALWHRRIWLTVYFASVIAGGVAIALISVVKAGQSVTCALLHRHLQHLLILRIKDVSDSPSIDVLYPGCLTVNEHGKSLYSAYIMLVVHGASELTVTVKSFCSILTNDFIVVFFLMVIVWYKSFRKFPNDLSV